MQSDIDALAAELAEVTNVLDLERGIVSGQGQTIHILREALAEVKAENWALRQRVERYVARFGDEDDPYDDCRVQLGGRCKCGDGKHRDLAEAQP